MLKKLQKEYDIIILPTGWYLPVFLASTSTEFSKPVVLYIHTLSLISKRTPKFLLAALKILKPNMSNLYILTYDSTVPSNKLELVKMLDFLRQLGAKVATDVPYGAVDFHHHVKEQTNLNQTNTKSILDKCEALPCLCYLGHAVTEKGYNYVVDFIEKLLRFDRNKKYKFVISSYLDKATEKQNVQNYREKVLKLQKIYPENIEVFSEPLTMEQYNNALKSSDIILLLYDPKIYSTCFSGILLEAFTYGKPVIVRSGTWLAQQVVELGGGVKILLNCSDGSS